jgi:glucose uptake protein GlcU
MTRVYKEWKNTYASFIVTLILSLIFVNVFCFYFFNYSQNIISIIWPIGISIIIVSLSYRLMSTLKYRLQRKFINKTPLQISKSVSVSLNNLNLLFSIDHQTSIASSPDIIADTLFIVDKLGLKIGLVPFPKGTWVFIIYNNKTLKNELIKICKEIDDTIE